MKGTRRRKVDMMTKYIVNRPKMMSRRWRLISVVREMDVTARVHAQLG